MKTIKTIFLLALITSCAHTPKQAENDQKWNNSNDQGYDAWSAFVTRADRR